MGRRCAAACGGPWPLLGLVVALSTRCQARQVVSLDDDWRFQLEPAPPGHCAADTFPLGLYGRKCGGLVRQGRPEDGGPGSAEECRARCCRDPTCGSWQWCAKAGGSGGRSSGADGEDDVCDAPDSCWLGPAVRSAAACNASAGWLGGSGRSTPPPPPAPGTPCSVAQCQKAAEDASWRVVQVPHDFVVEGEYSQVADKSHGYLPYRTAWYRRHFTVPAEARDQTVWLDFDGVMVSSEVWLNGKYLGGHTSGYTPFRFELGGASSAAKTVHWGGPNVLAVRVDANKPGGWWYDGGGIYRHVWLTIAPPVHIVPWGVYAPAIVVGEVNQISGTADAELRPVVELANNGTTTASVRVKCLVRDGNGQVVGLGASQVSLPADHATEVQLDPIKLLQARLWSVDRPTLYTVTTEVTATASGQPGSTDTVDTRIGVRHVRWDAQTGFYLNGVSLKIKGTANHQDFAAVGVAVPDVLQAHRIQKLKEIGSNAWRCAHNAPTVALLDAADELGFLVWDENHRNGEDAEMETLVRRDRNHPSIVIWSVCNEVLCDTDNRLQDLIRLKDIAKRLDPLMGRVVSANNNDLNGKNTVLDLQGFDYAAGAYDAWHALAPNVPAISSETSSAVSDRGEYSNDPKTGHVSGYDINAPSWGQTAQVAWSAILRRPFIAGGFTWTGWDYRGEPTPYQWPNVNSHFGILDAAGFPKDRAYWYRAWWGQPSPPSLYLFPHWNWEEAGCRPPCHLRHGQLEVVVWAYSNADEVELLLPGGRSFGRRKCGDYGHAEWWHVPFTPGRLEARAYVAGRQQPVAIAAVETTGPATAVRLRIKDGVGASGLRADGRDVALVVAELVDDHGRVVPTASHPVTFVARGGDVLGTGNGDPSSHVLGASSSRPAFHGLVMAVIRAGRTEGQLEVTAVAPGLSSSGITIPLRLPESFEDLLPI